MANRTKLSRRSASDEDPPSSVLGFTKGAILKIVLKDFMTYTEVECVPGPNLNLILGPNGTGKSTIVSAICLGMNGKASTLSRAGSVGGYVRNGTEKATIEIELCNPSGENYHITREITRDNRSTWKLQGKSVTQNEVNKVIQSLHIQVDNLCQFLPQEKVQDFSRMKDKELLMGTMNAVGNPDLEHNFNELVRMQAQLGSVSTDQSKDLAECSSLRAENERCESEVRNFKERESLKLKIQLLEKKKTWLVYKEELDQFKAAQQRSNEIKRRYDEAAAKFAPLEQKIIKKENLIVKTQAALTDKRDRFNRERCKLNAHLTSAEDKKSKWNALVSNLSRKRAAEQKRQEDVMTLQNQIRQLTEDIQRLAEQEQQSGSEMQDVNRRLNEFHARETQAFQRKELANDEVRQLKMEQNECTSQLRHIQNMDRNRLELLRKNNCQGVAQAVEWLRQNAGRFNRTIYEPLILSVNMKDPKMAKYLENRVPFHDLTAFYCEDKDDMNKLMRVLREDMKLQGINVVHAPPSGDSNAVEFQPRMAISELREFGFSSYLRELFTGPEPVVSYLCRSYQVHNIPVGDRRAYENLGVIRERYGTLFNYFFADNKIVAIKSSRYRRELITRTDEAVAARFLNESVDTQRLEQLTSTLADVGRRLETAQRALDGAVDDTKAVGKEKEALMQRKSQLQKLGGERRVAESRVAQKRQSLRGLQADAVDLDAEEAKVKRETAACVRGCIGHLDDKAKLLDALLVLDRERQALQIHMAVLQAAVSKIRKQLHEERDQIKQLEDAKREAERETAAAKERVSAALQEARRVSGAQSYAHLDDAVKVQLAELPDTLAEVDEAVHSASARVQLMGRGDQKVVDDYVRRKRRIDELTKKIEGVQNAAANLKQQINELREAFLPPLLDLIGRINQSFGRFFATMQCAGEVQLYTGASEDQNDFANYGIKIRVKYRSSEPLLELDANHHSGGERAVATALYMLAMQELTHVPFRCVDEINQGMDPINERRVFDLLVQTACQETSAQYFLLTPKLLTGLKYSPHMKIHFVQNGEDVMNYKKWQIEKHIKTLRDANGL